MGEGDPECVFETDCLNSARNIVPVLLDAVAQWLCELRRIVAASYPVDGLNLFVVEMLSAKNVQY